MIYAPWLPPLEKPRKPGMISSAWLAELWYRIKQAFKKSLESGLGWE
jgi:hypothetical protein